MSINRIGIWLCLLLGSVTAVACRHTPDTGTADLTITLISSPTPTLADTTLILSLLDGQGQPVDDAQLEVRGDMTHAGMTPILGTAVAGQDGQYTIPFPWSMAGDWILTIRATMPDGSWREQQINLRVAEPKP